MTIVPNVEEEDEEKLKMWAKVENFLFRWQKWRCIWHFLTEKTLHNACAAQVVYRSKVRRKFNIMDYSRIAQ